MVSPGWEVLADTDKHLAPKRIYVSPGGIDNQVAMIYDSGAGWKTLFFLRDHLGSVLALATPGGDIVESYEYEPYGLPTVYDDEGEIVASRTSTVGNRFMFTGREWEPEGQFYHYRHRTYSPHEKRFMQRDPIGLAGGWNVYAYCGGDPVNASDPMGLWKQTSLWHWNAATASWSLEVAWDVSDELLGIRSRLDRITRGCGVTANLMIAEGLYALLVTANKVGAISYGPFTDPLVGGSTDGNGRITLNENWKSTEYPPTFNYFFDGSLGWAVLEQSGTSSSGVQDSLLHEAMHRAQALGWGKHGFGIGVFQDRVLHPFTPENRETEAPAYAIHNWFLYPGSCVGPE